jgi:hypothetical protein
MKTIINKSKAPLALQLPGGKKLFLSPGKSGQIADKAVDHPPIKKLIESEQIEVVDEGGRSNASHDGRGGSGRTQTHGIGGPGVRRTGER